MNRIYRMGQKQFQGVLKVAKENIGIGIYAIEKNGYAELRCDRCDSITRLKSMKRQFKHQGFKVYANEGI